MEKEEERGKSSLCKHTILCCMILTSDTILFASGNVKYKVRISVFFFTKAVNAFICTFTWDQISPITCNVLVHFQLNVLFYYYSAFIRSSEIFYNDWLIKHKPKMPAGCKQETQPYWMEIILCTLTVTFSILVIPFSWELYICETLPLRGCFNCFKHLCVYFL